jgi:hypothetical protein
VCVRYRWLTGGIYALHLVVFALVLWGPDGAFRPGLSPNEIAKKGKALIVFSAAFITTCYFFIAVTLAALYNRCEFASAYASPTADQLSFSMKSSRTLEEVRVYRRQLQQFILAVLVVTGGFLANSNTKVVV